MLKENRLRSGNFVLLLSVLALGGCHSTAPLPRGSEPAAVAPSEPEAAPPAAPAPPAPLVATDQLEVPVRAEESLGATRVHGPLTVREGERSFESRVKPWSSWWFPLRDTYLFESRGGNRSPLEKLDLYARNAHGVELGAAQFEREKIYDPGAASWEGLCNAWALASVLEPEPLSPTTRNGVLFGVGDQKALLVKTYEEVKGLAHFGQRYDGARASVYEDIYPDQLHRIIEKELFEKGLPFVMDKDPGVAVWNTPVWAADVRIARDAADPHVAHVRTWLSGASPFVGSYDFVGTERVVFQYDYDLYGYPQSDGSLKVEFGVWTGDSLEYHPDFITARPEPGTFAHRSRNTAIEPGMVREILTKM